MKFGNAVSQSLAADVLVGALGYGIVLALLYVVLYGDVVAASLWPERAVVLRGASAAAGLSAVLLVSYGLCDRLARANALAVAGLAAMVFAAVAGICLLADQLGMPVSLGATIAMCFVAGGSVGAMGMAWGEFVATRERGGVFVPFVIAFLVGGLVVFFFALVSPESRYAVAVALAFVQVVFLFSFFQSSPVSGYVSREASVDALRIKATSRISYGLTAVVIGASIASVAVDGPVWETYLEIGIGLVGGATVAVFVSRVKGEGWMLLGPIERFTLPFIVALQLLVPYTPSMANHALAVVLIVLYFVREISRIVNRSALAAERRAQSCYLYAKTTLPFAVGLFVGILFYGAMAAAHIPFSSVLLAVLIALGAMIAPYGSDPLTVPAPVSDERANPAPERTTWDEACAAVSGLHGLTPREAEVLAVLSRGRSASVVARELGISVNTVKSHMQSIYRKLGVETHQDLIDLVEAASDEAAKEQRGVRRHL